VPDEISFERYAKAKANGFYKSHAANKGLKRPRSLDDRSEGGRERRLHAREENRTKGAQNRAEQSLWL